MQAKSDLDTTCINTIRTLAMDAVQAANSGHPGAPMALAPVAYWAKYVGTTGCTLGMNSFGASAPLKDLLKKFGFTPEHVVAAARERLRLPSH